MTEQEQQKADVRSRLERIWTRWQAGLARRDYQLVVLAVPTYPGDIEAVSAMDMHDVADLLAAFSEHRKANPNELHAIKPAVEPAPRQDWQPLDEGVTDGQPAGAGPEQVGQGDDGGRAPQERADAPAEPHEGDAAGDALELNHTRTPMWLREQRIKNAVETGVPCRPMDKPDLCGGCGPGPCTGMFSRLSDHNEA